MNSVLDDYGSESEREMKKERPEGHRVGELW